MFYENRLTRIILRIIAAIAIAMGGTLFLDKTAFVSLERINEAKTFLEAKGFNPGYCIFADFSAYSGSKRFMLYSYKEKRIILKCKCASGKNKNEFSNEPGSNLSSLGRYRIGKKRILKNVNGWGDISRWKIPCYELHGLDNSNSNAYKRGILIHPDPLLFNIPLPIILPNHSQGCFSIPESSFKELDIILSKSEKPILLIAFN